ncbi:MAG: ABC-F type ribosomal protection protein [Firmicutes bacterium]|nr:ABC-F type ribosomal protection protein [Bacillota bacterium]
MIELSLNGIQKYYGATKVLDDITFEAKTGERIGIVGRNGTGKTTIFKVISGLEDYNGGVLSLRKGVTVGYLDQIPDYPQEYKVIDVLKTAFEEIFKVREEMKKLEEEMASVNQNDLDVVMKKYGKLQSTFEHMGGYDIDEKISKISSGLKISDQFMERKFINLSGGEKTTVVLGKILMQNPDILLLDEPSNHLDIESVEWLEGFLKEYNGTALMISHDRYFLDMVATRIVEIEDMKTEIYEGNYSYYVEEKERRLIAQFEVYQNQQKKIKGMEEAIKRFRDWGTRADNEKMFIKARNMQKRIDKMDKVDKPTLEHKKMKLDFSIQDRSGKDVVRIEKLRKAFGDNLVLDGLNLHVRYGEKVAILGKNGSGKSTLIKILNKEYDADEGKVKLGASVKIGYLDQNIYFDNEDQTILESFREKHIMPEGRARGILAGFLFFDEDVFKKVKDLSGGEKSRLKLCQLMYEDINFLILDEPTNHLDIDSREMLEASLDDFEGTILFISHDRYFINKISERITEIRNRKLYSYGGNYNYYKRKKEEEKDRIEAREQKKERNQQKSKNVEKNPNENKQSKSSYKYKINQMNIEKLEKEIEKLEKHIELKENEMKQYSTDHEKLADLFKEKETLDNKLNRLIEEWTKLSSEII